MILDDDQVDDGILFSLIITSLSAAISFYLDNPIWRYTTLGIILFFNILAIILYNQLKRRFNRRIEELKKLEIEYPLKEKIRELKDKLEEIKNR